MGADHGFRGVDRGSRGFGRAGAEVVGHIALALDRPTRAQIEQQLRALHVSVTSPQLDASLERLQLHFALLPQLDSESGLEQWRCPVPLIARFERRIRPWNEHLEHDARELRQADGVRDRV